MDAKPNPALLGSFLLIKELGIPPSELGFNLKNPMEYIRFMGCLKYVKKLENGNGSHDHTEDDAYINKELEEQLGAPPPEYIVKQVKKIASRSK